MYKSVFAGAVALGVAGGAFAQDAGTKASSNEAPLAAVAEVAALQLCVAWATAGEAPAAFQPDLSQDVYDLQPGPFELGRFGKITTATGDLRIAVFPQEKVCRIGVGDAPVEEVKAQLLAALKAPDSGWQETAAKDEDGAWRVQFTSLDLDRPVQLAVNGYDAPRDGGRGRQLVVTVGQTLVD
jgi:hypothetical protein